MTMRHLAAMAKLLKRRRYTHRFLFDGSPEGGMIKPSAGAGSGA